MQRNHYIRKLYPWLSYASGALEKRGVGALELVAMDMKTRLDVAISEILKFNFLFYLFNLVCLEVVMQMLFTLTDPISTTF